jgi:uncharacterized protein (TIGR02391 family)
MPLPEPYLPTNSDDLIALPITERGLRLLQVLAKAEDQREEWNWVHAHNLLNPPSWSGRGITGDLMAYLRGISEAWAWLVAEGFVAARPDQSSSDACFVTARARHLLADRDPRRRLLSEQRLSVDLHPRLNQRVRTQFLLGEVELAAFAAMREVEIRVREIAALSTSDIGVKLMRNAFGPGGSLRPSGRDPGEQNAVADLFAGAIGVFKNPSSHREVDYSDPVIASEVVLLADLLLRLLEQNTT